MAVSQALLSAQEDVKRCGNSIDAALLKVEAALDSREERHRDFWREELNHLRVEEQLLREKEIKLLDIRRLLLEREAASALTLHAPGFPVLRLSVYPSRASLPWAASRLAVRFTLLCVVHGVVLTRISLAPFRNALTALL
eukprot:6201423-Pleurochrysis_carterae.AAC.1